MRSARSLVLAPASAAALALGGCGGQTATKKDVIAQADAICASALRAVRATPPPAATSLSALSPYLEQVVQVVDKEVASLRKLPRPAQDRALLDRWLAAESRSRSEYATLATAAHRGDRQATTQALATIGASPAPELAKRYGALQCANASSTSVS